MKFYVVMRTDCFIHEESYSNPVFVSLSRAKADKRCYDLNVVAKENRTKGAFCEYDVLEVDGE